MTREWLKFKRNKVTSRLLTNDESIWEALNPDLRAPNESKIQGVCSKLYHLLPLQLIFQNLAHDDNTFWPMTSMQQLDFIFPN